MEWSITWASPPLELVAVIQDAITGNLDDSSIAQEWEADEYLGRETG